jgi:hypothetical protein
MGGRLSQQVSGWYEQFNRPDDPKIPSTVLTKQTRDALNKMGMGDVISAVESPQGIVGLNNGDTSSDSSGAVDYKSKYGLK